MCHDTMVALKKNHSEWDRRRREWNGQLTKSKTNKNTKGSVVEADLRLLMDGGVAIDTALQDYENKWIAQGSFATEKSATSCSQ